MTEAEVRIVQAGASAREFLRKDAEMRRGMYEEMCGGGAGGCNEVGRFLDFGIFEVILPSFSRQKSCVNNAKNILEGLWPDRAACVCGLITAVGEPTGGGLNPTP